MTELQNGVLDWLWFCAGTVFGFVLGCALAYRLGVHRGHLDALNYRIDRLRAWRLAKQAERLAKGRAL